MRSKIAGDLGIEFPIFAFSHCRDVVAEVSRRGGFGVLGAVKFTPEELDMECKWIDEHCGGRPYGIDVLIPTKTADPKSVDVTALTAQFQELVPKEHREFARKILAENGFEARPLDAPFNAQESMSSVHTRAISAGPGPLVDVTLAHPLIRLFVSALGSAPPDVIERLHANSIQIGALAGTRRHAERHVQRGVDVIIAQGTEAGGHTGDVTTMVLTPEVVDAVSPVPVLAAGGIGTGRQMAAAMALGAQGIWTGSIWLAVKESETTPEAMAAMFAATSSDTVRSRSFSGKPIRQLKSPWTDSWSRPEAPPTLEMPLQEMLLIDAAPEGTAPKLRGLLGRPIVGQIVGRLEEVRSVRAVLEEMISEFIETINNMSKLIEFE